MERNLAFIRGKSFGTWTRQLENPTFIRLTDHQLHRHPKMSESNENHKDFVRPLSSPLLPCTRAKSTTNHSCQTQNKPCPNNRKPPKTHNLLYHLQTIHLFTRSDLKTIVAPSTFFALICAFSTPTLQLSHSPLPTLHIVSRVPKTAFWVWCNLLPFAIDNQRQPSSIEEDKLNKPWRPMPSARISILQATHLMVVLYALAFTISTVITGGSAQCVMLMGLGYWYNEFHGADRDCVVRNFINACGYTCFLSGALEVMLERSVFAFPVLVYEWLFVIGLVVFSTVHAQDMGDQEGDGLRGRWTVPLVVGDVGARYSIAGFVLVWSCVCVGFWELHVYSLVVSMSLGGVVGERFLGYRTRVGDRVSFRVYNVWVAFIFSLPLWKT
ncbi:unnamed protein product [Periconia digitata]|uniref:Uncharacterized protein n=1 Tax=Periconia digitata TaxID=1303443 RepID=A0A9W4UKX5_9PLEO|nr:unnamed protein product [Periconia digitata]